MTCVNLLAKTEEQIHPMWEAAAETPHVVNTPLRELLKLMSVYPANGKKSVWVVENSGVYSSILDKLPHVPLICTHGQFKLSALILMDKLVREGCTIYYAGDIDPEGLSMAERLLRRHPKHVQMWKMGIDYYHVSLSDLELTKERLSKLNSVKNSKLKLVVEALWNNKKAGYQEALVYEMIGDLESTLV